MKLRFAIVPPVALVPLSLHLRASSSARSLCHLSISSACALLSSPAHALRIDPKIVVHHNRRSTQLLQHGYTSMAQLLRRP